MKSLELRADLFDILMNLSDAQQRVNHWEQIRQQRMQQLQEALQAEADQLAKEQKAKELADTIAKAQQELADQKPADAVTHENIATTAV